MQTELSPDIIFLSVLGGRKKVKLKERDLGFFLMQQGKEWEEQFQPVFLSRCHRLLPSKRQGPQSQVR